MSLAASPRPTGLSPEQYLVWEQDQEDRYELVDGQVRMMAGGTHSHHLIALNIAMALRTVLRGGPCVPLTERKVLTPRSNYRYPDVVVDCGRPAANDLAADQPRVVFEVESPSNTAIDEFERFEDYQSAPSIQQIVLVSQTSARARIYTRAGTDWRAETVTGLEAALDLSALGCTLLLAEVFEGVELQQRGEG